MKESFIFYKSFYEAINLLGEKAQLKLYKSIMRLNFDYYETPEELRELCCKIESELRQNRSVFAQFLLIKPQILANLKKYCNMSKTHKYQTSKPISKNTKSDFKMNFQTPYNENENEKLINENTNKNTNDKYIEKFKKIYKKIFGQIPILIKDDFDNLSELLRISDDFEETLEENLKKLKEIDFKKIGYKPKADWFLKPKNYAALRMGAYQKKEKEDFIFKQQEIELSSYNIGEKGDE